MYIMFSSVFLPTFDVVCDLWLVIPWYLKGHYHYATLMTIPMVLNYPITIYKWCLLEKTSDRKWSWILVSLQLWQQWRMIKIIYLLLKKDARAQEKKKELLKQLSGIEPFFESVPALIILSCIVFHAVNVSGVRKEINEGIHRINSPDSKYHLINCTDPLRPLVYKNLCELTENGGVSKMTFMFHKLTLSGSWGIMKFLQNGPCAILSTNGYLGGLLNWRFIISFVAVYCSLSIKAVMGAALVVEPLFCDHSLTGGSISYVCLVLSIYVFTNLILSISSIASATGFSKKFLKIVFNYPSLLLLSVYTHFAAGPGALPRCKKSIGTSKNKHIIVSKTTTAINTGLTVLSHIIAIIVILAADHEKYGRKQAEDVFRLFIALPIYISVCCTFIFIGLDSLVACRPGCNNCGVTLCCTPCCFESRCDCIDLDNPTNENTASVDA